MGRREEPKRFSQRKKKRERDKEYSGLKSSTGEWEKKKITMTYGSWGHGPGSPN